eukprot:UN34803
MEAQKLGKNITYDETREMVYGMPYKEFKRLYQKPATKEQIENLKNPTDTIIKRNKTTTIPNNQL